MKTIAFFNNKGGVGKTSLLYHLAWMFSDLGHNTIVADLDPQSNLTSMFLDEDILEDIWPNGDHPKTIYGAIQPVIKGTGDISPPHLCEINQTLHLIPGDLSLSRFEDELSSQWPDCLDKKEKAFRIISTFYRLVKKAADEKEAELAFIDVGPNLGAINRAALLASDFVAIPLAPDLFSLQGLRNLGPTLHEWREGWQERLQKCPVKDLELPRGSMKPIGYIVQQHATRKDRPVKSYDRWIKRIPREYRNSVLHQSEKNPPLVEKDPHCLAMIKHFRSLMPMAMEVQKPMFFLKPADGAIGAHVNAVQQCYDDFKQLAITIQKICTG